MALHNEPHGIGSVDRIDMISVVRGGSAGFTILIIGGLLGPAAARLPYLGYYWLVGVAVIGFATAGARGRNAGNPALQGSVTALMTYALVLPWILVAGDVGANQIVGAAGVAAVTGAMAAVVAERVSRASRSRQTTRSGQFHPTGLAKESS